MEAQLIAGGSLQELEIVKSHQNQPDIAEAIEYLKQNPNSELAIEIMEDWLLEDANTYGFITFNEELDRIKRNDPVKNCMLETFIDGWLLKNGYLKANAEFVSKSYKKRLKELEKIEKKNKVSKFFLQIAAALKIIFSEKNRNETIVELESATAEAALARSEAKDAQSKTQQALKEADEIAIKASGERRQKLEKADREALELAAKIKQAAQQDLDNMSEHANRLRQEILILEAERQKLLVENPALAVAFKIHSNPVKELKDVYTRTFWNTKTELITHGYDVEEKQVEYETTPDKAVLISSLCENGDHAPVIDLDFPVEVIPSTTKGHHHLYLNKRIPWKEYKNLLRAMLAAGLIEKGWYDMCIKKVRTSVLLPGIKRNEVSLPKESRDDRY